jgi:hypothetical protein
MRNATAFPIMFFLALFFRSAAIVGGSLVAKTNRDVGPQPLALLGWRGFFIVNL